MEWPFVVLFAFLGLLAVLIKIASLGYFQKDGNPYKTDDEEKPPRD